MALDEDLNRVIEAIDKLRTRKNRPNLPGIARFLAKAHGFFADKTINLLEILLSQNRVKEVVYKGNISFRNMLRWRQPTRPVHKRLDARVDTSVVVTTMLRLLLEDQDKEDDTGGISETRLQAALIEQLNGAAKLKEIRKQIQVEVEKGTLGKNEAGDFILLQPVPKKTNSIDLDMDELSDLSDFVDAPETSPESTDDSLLDSSMNIQPILITSSNTVKQLISVPDTKKILENLDKSIDNVVNNIQNTKDSIIMTEPELKQIKRKEQDITCHLTGKTTSDIRDNKRRRIIRKKTIYDPSEFELTPLIKRNKKRATSATTAPRGRGSRGRKAAKDGKVWISANEMELSPAEQTDVTPVTPFAPQTKLIMVDEKCESTPEILSPADSPKDNKEKKCRGKPPMNVNKQCCICSFAADKMEPSILSCSLCLNIAHKDCVKVNSFYKGSLKWRCEDCKEYNPVVCSVCELEASKKQIMLMCDFCEEFFHAECHYPPVDLPLAESTWRCSACPVFDRNERLKIKTEEEPINTTPIKVEDSDNYELDDFKFSVVTPNVKDRAISPPPVKRKILQICEKVNVEPKRDLSSKNNIMPITIKVSGCIRHKPNEPIPLVDDWTVQQVSDYFLEKFGKDVADAFLTQEIDGKFLKQMSRQYVTNDLGLQLGIALKVLYYVKKIQLGTNLFQQLWAST